MRIAIKNGIILPMTIVGNEGEKYFNGHIGIEDKRICLVTQQESLIDHFIAQGETKVIDGSNRVVMPGLINTHTHVPMTILRGFADDMSLHKWLTEKIWPFEEKLSGEDIYWGTKLGIAEMILSGTTTMVDMYMQMDYIASAATECGIRAYLSEALFDQSANHVIEAMDRKIERWHRSAEGRIEVMASAHAPYTCSPETLTMVRKGGLKHGLRFHIHLSETEEELSIIRKRYDKSPVEYLYDLGMFDMPTLTAHCIYLSASDQQRIKENGVNIIHNPQSNMKLGSGICPISQYLDQGINVSLGTDGASSNNNLCMWDELRSASLLQKVFNKDAATLPAYQTLQMVTVNGAKSIGMEGKLGILQEGAIADVIMIDINKPHHFPRFDLVSHLVFSMQGSDVETVIINGKVIMEKRKIGSFDVEESCHEVEQRAKRIAKIIH